MPREDSWADIRRAAKSSTARWVGTAAAGLVITAAGIVFNTRVASRADVEELRLSDIKTQQTFEEQQKLLDERDKELAATRALLGDVAGLAVDLRARLRVIPMRDVDRERGDRAAKDAKESFFNLVDRQGVKTAVDRALKE